MGLIELIFGPFVLLGILIVALTVMSGGKAERALTGYLRLCGQLFSSLLLPIINRLPFFIQWLGEHFEYLLDAQIKAHNERKFFDNFANAGTNRFHHGETTFSNKNDRGKVITVQVKDITEQRNSSIGKAKQSNPYDEDPDIEAVEN